MHIKELLKIKIKKKSESLFKYFPIKEFSSFFSLTLLSTSDSDVFFLAALRAAASAFNLKKRAHRMSTCKAKIVYRT